MTVLCATCANVDWCDAEDVEGCAEYEPAAPGCGECGYDRLTCDVTGRCFAEENREAVS